MPLCVMSALMLIVAHISGVVCDPSRCKRTYRYIAILFLALIIFIHKYVIVFSAELSLSPASLLFFASAAVSYARAKQSARHTLSLIGISIALSLAFRLLLLLMEHEVGLLACGLLAASANILFKQDGRSILLICALSPVLLEAEGALLRFALLGYSYFELASNSLDMMLICALFSGFAHGIVNWSTQARSEEPISA